MAQQTPKSCYEQHSETGFCRNVRGYSHGRNGRYLICHGGCIALDSSMCRALRRGGEKIEHTKKEPRTVSRIIAAAIQHIPLYCLLFAQEHQRDREKDLGKLIWLHGQKHELFFDDPLVACWGRMCYEYTEAMREDVRTMTRMLPEGAAPRIHFFGAHPF